MPLDTLICGLCDETFTDLNDFVVHKQTGCGPNQHGSVVKVEEHPQATGPPLSQPMSAPEMQQQQQQQLQQHDQPVVPVQLGDVGQISKLSSHNDGDAVDTSRADTADTADLTFLDDVHNMEAELGLVERPSDNSSSNEASTHTYVILKDAVDLETTDAGSQDAEAKMESAFAQLEGSELEVLSTSQLMDASSAINDSGTTTVVISQEEFEAILQKQQQGQIAVFKDSIPAKKPRVGRAKKGEGKNQILEAVPPSAPRPSAPETNADGKLACPQCKRTFTKERHFNTHKCLASSSYVDISKRDVVKIDSGDEEEETNLYLEVDDGAHDDEDDREFSAPMEESMQVEREDEEDEQEMDKDEDEEGYCPGDNDNDGVSRRVDQGNGVDDDDDDDDDDSGSAPKRRKIVRRRGRQSRVKAKLENNPLEGASGNQMKQAVEAMENLPIFKNEEDKVAFEACIDVDLSQVDHMFRVHVIEQELNNSSGVVYNTPTVSSLSVYSCTVCEKVFKSLSHIRLHCITHTDLKPFKCHKCDYTTNSKGNLYTHMRKHTGQYYRCDQCEFKTVNKSHLVEHQMTHDSRRPTCLLCNKDYSTIKSMINHIRKYHTNKAGREYLATFLSGRGQKGNAIIHQCHVCNRKFKKRIDRDRHLFVHDIKDLPNVQMCQLCDYWASRKVYLDKHYCKHRVIYCCAICQNKFLSVIRLTEHLNMEHCSSENNGLLLSDALLQECINKSFYLPEPVAPTLEGNNSKYINLPSELTESGQQDNGSQAQTATKEKPNESSEIETFSSANPASGRVESVNDIGNNNNTSYNPQGTNDDINDDDDVKLLRLTDDPHKMETSTDLMDVSHNDIVVSTASSSTHSSAFPFASEYRDLIHGAAAEIEDGVSNLKSAEEMMMLMPSPQGTLTDSDNPVVMPCLPSGDIGTAGGEDDDKSNMMSSSLTSNIHDKENEANANSLDNGGSQTLSGDGKEGKDESTSRMLMLQNPGSDTEDKEEEGVEEGSVEHAGMGVGEVDNNEGEVTTDPQLGEEDGVDKEGHEESDNGNASQEENAVEKTEGQTDVNAQGRDEESVKPEEINDDKIQSIIQKMGYRKMTYDIFSKMRETFGGEECEYCGRLFYSKLDHQTHIRTHTGDKPFACTHCSFRSSTRDGLRRHSEKEHEKIAYQCKECDFLAPTRTRLWNHQLKHLGITGLSCTQCPEKFESMKQLRSHLVNSHQDMDKEDMDKLTGYVTRPQGKMGRRSYKCPHCPRVFLRANSEFQKHIWIHEGIKPFACPLCPYACRSKNNLQAHMLRHSAEKPFSCSECGKEYKSKTALRWHVRSHKSGKLFKCDKCPYEATQSSHLKRHMEIHDVMKQFVCKHCKYSANTLGYMKIHYAKHHKGQPFIHEESNIPKDSIPSKGVYKCLSCGYLFGNLSDLKRHLKVRHHIQMQDIAGMDQMQISEVEVVQFDDTAVVVGSQPLPDIQQVPQVQQVLPPTQVAATADFQLRPQDESSGSMPASTANLIQQILGMNQGENQQVRVVSEDGQPLDISPDTIILQQDGQLLMTNEMPGSLLPGNQYIIQYFNPGEMPQESQVMGDNSATSSIQQPIVSVAGPDQLQLVQTVGKSQQPVQQQQHQSPQPTQFIITSGGDIGATNQLATQVVATAGPNTAAGDNQQYQSVQLQSTPSPHLHIQSAPSNLNSSVNQFVMATPSDIASQQLISIDGQTHQLLNTTTTTSTTATNSEISVDNELSGHDSSIISSIHHQPQHQSHHQLENSNQLLSVVEGESQYVTSDVDAYSSQLIISDREVGVDDVTQGVDLVGVEDSHS